MRRSPPVCVALTVVSDAGAGWKEARPAVDSDACAVAVLLFPVDATRSVALQVSRSAAAGGWYRCGTLPGPTVNPNRKWY